MSRNILVVDDDPRYLDLLRQRLQAAGFNVLLAFDGESGLERAKGEPRPDAVLTDVLLPRIDGFALCHALKSDPSTAKIPVLMMSAIYLTDADRERGLRNGAQQFLIKPDIFLAKPIRFEDLLENLRFLLGEITEQPAPERADHLLVVDDDERSRRMLKMALTGRGYALHEAPDGHTALEILDSSPVDLVLSDVQMPGMSGLDLLAEIRRRRPETMVVMMTAYGSEKIAVEAMKRGANDYLTKPIEIRELSVVLRENLEKHRLAVERERLLEQLKETSRDLMSRVERLEHQNQELEASRREIERASRVQIELVSTISHELRTPLTVIKGALKMVLEARDKLNEERREDLLHRSLTQTDRVISLTNTFLDLERFESGRVQLDLDPLDLLEVVRTTCEALEPAAQAAKMTLRCASPLAEAPARADREAVERILDNLIGNAIKYASGGSEVEIVVKSASDKGEAGRSVDGFRLEIRDRGPGVPDRLKEQIFERFVRQGAVVPGTPSTGLGLAIVRSLAELHGGTVGIADREGGGAVFWVWLPEGAIRPSEDEVRQAAAVIGIGVGRDLAPATAKLLGNHDREWLAFSDPLKIDGGPPPACALVDLSAREVSEHLVELLRDLGTHGGPPTWILPPADGTGDHEAARLFPFVEVLDQRPTQDELVRRLEEKILGRKSELFG